MPFPFPFLSKYASAVGQKHAYVHVFNMQHIQQDAYVVKMLLYFLFWHIFYKVTAGLLLQ
jgi:hypothetical protein